MATLKFDYLDVGSATVTSGSDQLAQGAVATHVSGPLGTPALNAVGEDAVFELSNDFTSADLAAGNDIIFAGLNAGEKVAAFDLGITAGQGASAAMNLEVLHSDGTTTTLASGLATDSAGTVSANSITDYTAVQGDQLQLAVASAASPTDATVTVTVTKNRPA